jgi:hypothetical protein
MAGSCTTRWPHDRKFGSLTIHLTVTSGPKLYGLALWKNVNREAGRRPRSWEDRLASSRYPMSRRSLIAIACASLLSVLVGLVHATAQEPAAKIVGVGLKNQSLSALSVVAEHHFGDGWRVGSSWGSPSGQILYTSLSTNGRDTQLFSWSPTGGQLF